MSTASTRFAMRRSPIVDEYAVIDTKNKGRIVHLYKGGDAFGDAKRAVIAWNKNPPTLQPRLNRPRTIIRILARGVVHEEPIPWEPRPEDPSDTEYIFPK